MSLVRGLCTVLLIFLLIRPAVAEIRLPSIFGDHMVLQQRSNVTIWGWCLPDERISVTLEWDTTRYSTIGTAEARWSIVIPTPAAGGPYAITLSGDNTVVLRDVLIGEVWLCSGQSNMEMPVRDAMPENGVGENSSIRFFVVSKATSEFPQDNIDGEWKVSDPETAKNFSAVGYHFGNKLQSDLDVPIGLINASWGGTPAEVWTPEAIVKDDATLLSASKNLKPSIWWPVTPGCIYNAMIHPITNFTIRGVIWYQGEANVSQANSYQSLLTSMIGSWRKAWRNDFPFYYVQIAPYSGYGEGFSAALLREAQSKTLSYPGTGMIVITDLVDDINDIHPRLKKEVGLRLASYALGETYGKNVMGYKSPTFKHMKVEKDKIRIFFDHAEKGLVNRKAMVDGFYISGNDRKFYPAHAKVEKNTVVVWHKSVKEPVAVRFGFTNDAVGDLFSKDGLPVNSFRTDDWPTVTETSPVTP